MQQEVEAIVQREEAMLKKSFDDMVGGSSSEEANRYLAELKSAEDAEVRALTEKFNANKEICVQLMMHKICSVDLVMDDVLAQVNLRFPSVLLKSAYLSISGSHLFSVQIV